MLRNLVIALLCVTLASGKLLADFRIKSNFKMEGLVGLMNMEGTTDNLYSGDKAKMVNNSKMTNKVMKFLGAGKPSETADIFRLDKELTWEIEYKDQKYREQTFAEARAEIEKELADAEKKKAKQLKDHPEDSLQFKTTFDVQKTGKKEKIVGYEAAQYIITIMTYGKSKEGGEGTMRIVMDTWLAEGIGGNEQRDFYFKLGEKLGYSGRSKGSLEGVLIGLGVDPNEIKPAMKELQGASLRSTTKITLLGEDQKDAENSAELLTFTMEATEVSTDPIPATEFEVPTGFKLKK